MVMFKMLLLLFAFLAVIYIIFNIVVYFMRKGGGPGNWMTAMARAMDNEDKKGSKEFKSKLKK